MIRTPARLTATLARPTKARWIAAAAVAAATAAVCVASVVTAANSASTASAASATTAASATSAAEQRSGAGSGRRAPGDTCGSVRTVRAYLISGHGANNTVVAYGFSEGELTRIRSASEPGWQRQLRADIHGEIRYQVRQSRGKRGDVLTAIGVAPPGRTSGSGSVTVAVPHFSILALCKH